MQKISTTIFSITKTIVARIERRTSNFSSVFTTQLKIRFYRKKKKKNSETNDKDNNYDVKTDNNNNDNRKIATVVFKLNNSIDYGIIWYFTGIIKHNVARRAN